MKLSVWILMLWGCLCTAQDYYQEQWQKVEQLEVENKIEEAQSLVENLTKRARRKKDHDQLVKSFLFKAKFDMVKTEDAQQKILSELQQLIDQSKFPQRNIYHNIYAQLLSQYVMQNRWQIQNRTAGATNALSDFKTWDVSTFYAEIDQHFQASLESKKDLSKIPVTDYEAILSLNPTGRSLRPSLLDLLSHQALEFYKADFMNLTRPKASYTITEANAFLPTDQLLQTKRPVGDSIYSKYDVLQLFAGLEHWHKQKGNDAPYVAIVLNRLAYELQFLDSQKSQPRFVKFHERLQKEYASKSERAMVDAQLARYYYDQSSSVEKEKRDELRSKAINLAKLAVEDYMDSFGGLQAAALLSEIYTPQLGVQSQSRILPNRPHLGVVNYSNVDQATLYYIKVEHDFSQRQGYRDSIYRSELRSAQRGDRIQFTKKVDLPSADDTFAHSYEFEAPPLQAGTYLLLVTHPGKEELQIAGAIIQVSSLSIFKNNKGKRSEIRVLDRESGKPLKDVSLLLSRQDGKGSRRATTDQNGLASISPFNDRYQRIMAFKSGDTISESFYHYDYRNTRQREQTQVRTFMYLDRAIYRPGQTVYFKGIVLSHYQEQTNIVTDQSFKISVTDVNGSEVFTQEMTTNDFGSYHGEFNLPEESLTGQFRIEAVPVNSNALKSGLKYFEGMSSRVTSFQVEEYKRPRFEVDFEQMKTSYAINDSVQVTAFAKAYLGSNITGADVHYKVTRQAFVPWWKYSGYYPSDEQVIIDSDELEAEFTTDDKGKVILSFLASPDQELVQKDIHPIYTYTIQTSITDVNGETRTGTKSLRIGRQPIELLINAPGVLGPDNNELSVYAQNLNGEPIKAIIEVQIRRPRQPDHVVVPSQLPSAEFHELDEAAYELKFPYGPPRYAQEQDQWKQAPILFKKRITTDSLMTIQLPITQEWKNGEYVIYAKAIEADQGKDLDQVEEVVEQIEQKPLWANPSLPPVPSLISHQMEIKDGIANVDFFTSMDGVYVHLVTYDEQELVEDYTFFITQGKTSKSFDLTKHENGTLNFWYAAQRENHYETGRLMARLPQKVKDPYQITTQSFRNKLYPGVNEEWSFTLKNEAGKAMEAEVLASMYDQSLDEFAISRWSDFSFYSNRQRYNPSFFEQMTAKTSNNAYVQLDYDRKNTPQLLFDRWNFYGLTFQNFNWEYRRYKNRLAAKLQPPKAVPGKIVGKVMDINGEPLYGVTVVVKGTTVGSTTDFDGHFAIEADTGDTLVVNYIGFQTQQIKVRKDRVITIVLEDNVSQLDAVVVSGYRMKSSKRSSVSSAVVVNEEVVEMDMMLDDKDGSPADTPMDSIGDLNQTGSNTEAQNTKSVDFSNVQVRKDLKETAFFLPQLMTDNQGNLKFSFRSPEMLTQWKFRLFAHNKQAETARFTQEVITQKELSLVPNAPRFLREKDTIRFSTKIANLSDGPMQGTARLQLFDALSMQPIDKALQNRQPDKSFQIDQGGNTSVNWEFIVPVGTQAVTYRVLAQAGDFSDGEENLLPVITNRMLVTESRAFWVRAGEKQSLTMDGLLENTSSSLDNHQMVFEYTSNPNWYAIKSLPYLMEYEHECAEQTFSRYYANAVAAHILNSHPKVKAVFDSWSASGQDASLLERNQELKSVVIAHTPWLRDAQSETEQQQRLATLFDLNRTAKAKRKTLAKLEALQLGNGGFPWFKGGRINEYITRHIAAGMGHLNRLDINDGHRPQTDRIYRNAIQAVDAEWKRRLQLYLKDHKNLEDYSFGVGYWHYQYARSFDSPSSREDKLLREAKNIAFAKAETNFSSASLYQQLLMAIVLHRENKTKLAAKIMEGLRQTAVSTKESGMYWKSNTNSWNWYESNIETHALAVEAFAEIIQDDQIIEELQVWLLKNKRTNRWKSTKATADATYALLLHDKSWLDTQEKTRFEWAGKPLPQQKMQEVQKEAGSGYFKIKLDADEITKAHATMEVTNRSETTGYGGLYWQYFEDMDKILRDDENGPLSVKKSLFKKVSNNSGDRLEAITPSEPLAIGDLVTVRIEIRSNADMNFIHLKDMRASGFEPVDVISTYKWQDGLGYYQSTKDVATHFFFDRLNKGTYVFEYELRANNAGNFSNGITSIESMYAPEFSSHSQGQRVEIKEVKP
ncbi:alpha-2-macroglobulin family protein [Nonlabens xiamenensis]|uniref:alpha-2-macroglobulin family protein n=1 Tax=Nonlabens xiamenensis TaxID=2341043 RepID=UPI000F60DDE5|nr:MG2 domain-containing protein [Nonlabens xiamenensis]